MSDDRLPGEDTGDGTRDDLAVLLERVANLTHDQRRLDLDLRRLDLDVQRLDATVQLMGTSVGALSSEVKQLGGFVQRLETKLDLNVERLTTHLRTIMRHIDVPLTETLTSARSREVASPAPGEAGD